MPIFSDLVVKQNASQFSRTLSTLMGAGVPMLDSIEMVAKMMNNKVFRDGLMETKTQVAKGIPLSKPLKDMEVFPTMLVQMVKIGEETGNIEDMMDKVADLYDREVDLATEALTAAMEPLTMVLMAGIVGVIVAGVYGPILSMYDGIDNM
jgi:type IV pilus assembly protein PilC